MSHSITPKELLSQHVEKIFESYTQPGLHICDLATGGGKSHAIAKLTSTLYSEHFDRVIILCVQTKLVKAMYDELIEALAKNGSGILSQEQILRLQNNPDIIRDAVKSSSKPFKCLIRDMEVRIDELKKDGVKVGDLLKIKEKIEGVYCLIEGFVEMEDKSEKREKFLSKQIENSESELRRKVRAFFATYRARVEKAYKKKITIDAVTRKFTNLVKVYPQVELLSKKVLLTTVHKAIYGIDTILSDNYRLSELVNKKKVLVILDESDQAGVAMRDVIIEQATGADGLNRYVKGYDGMQEYRHLTEEADHISEDYCNDILGRSLREANEIVTKKWQKRFQDVKPYNDIRLSEAEDLDIYRRGVFFSGPAIQLDIVGKHEKEFSYICYKKGSKRLTLVHTSNPKKLESKYSVIVPIKDFLQLVEGTTSSIKAKLRYVVDEALQLDRKQFEEENKEIVKKGEDKKVYLSYPTLEREIHTLFARFSTSSDYSRHKQQLHEFITNRKSFRFNVDGEDINLPDLSVYTQGVKLFQEDVDELDNLHNVRLSCREIGTTPEKIICDLLKNEDATVVLCSATASNLSVVSNFDIIYLKQMLDSKVHTLSQDDVRRFDELVEQTYPDAHVINVVPVKAYEFQDKQKKPLPEQYRNMFCKEAQEDGSIDTWYALVKYWIKGLEGKSDESSKNKDYEFTRLFQFVEAYHWFYTHDDIHSMIYFQNREGRAYQKEMIYTACLIDGSYKNQKSKAEDAIPTDWVNDHLSFSKEWEEMETDVLKKLKSDKNIRLMLVSAYGSFKAGANMQYEIPEGLENVLQGDNWDKKEVKKDWDAVFLQTPSSYLQLTEIDDTLSRERGLYKTMLLLAMFRERGYISTDELKSWLYQAICSNMKFSSKTSPGTTLDMAAWARTTIEQAVGRLCRTRNKPRTTYIMFDEGMRKFFEGFKSMKSQTKEYHHLVKFIQETNAVESIDVPSIEDMQAHNDADYSKVILDRIRKDALLFTIKKEQIEVCDEFDNDEYIKKRVLAHQKMISMYKGIILKKPVIASLDDLTEEDHDIPFIDCCYGKYLNREVSEKDVRLDVLMRNDIIREHFTRNGYATEWKTGGYIAHPDILKFDYAGEIGEEAFKALVLAYIKCDESRFVHQYGKNYELADFVLRNADGTNKVAFDVKNMNPNYIRHDGINDLQISIKREEKEKRLGCPLITINMLEIKGGTKDGHKEIAGLIDKKGNVLFDAIQQLKSLIEQ